MWESIDEGILFSMNFIVKNLLISAMMNIINKLYTTKPPLAFPNVIAGLCEAMEISYLASGPDEVVPKARPIAAVVMDNIRYPPVQLPPPQPHFYQEQLAGDAAQMPQEFYDSILAQQVAYVLRLQDLETRQKDMWAEQSQFHKDMRAYQEQQQEYQRQQ
ncbi:hypothetical protein PIB30_050768 [Stylosanthes scabra]|uniref:Uncharacterized protein n=1 Tax=Stylosanthes scabra TaxID=79078 RepID=A0ABU6WG37_9FABA|nr:hypothetical protein [Stylosanthes scabra]